MAWKQSMNNVISGLVNLVVIRLRELRRTRFSQGDVWEQWVIWPNLVANIGFLFCKLVSNISSFCFSVHVIGPVRQQWNREHVGPWLFAVRTELNVIRPGHRRIQIAPFAWWLRGFNEWFAETVILYPFSNLTNVKHIAFSEYKYTQQ